MKKLLLFSWLLLLVSCGKKPGKTGFQFASKSKTHVTEARGRIRLKPVLNREYERALLKNIDLAEKEILIAHFEYHYGSVIKRIQKRLAAASRRGVRVRMLLDDSLDFNRESISHLKRLGIDAKLDIPGTRLHAKVVIFDGKRVLMGSTNLSNKSIAENNETNVLITSPEAGKYFERFFDSLWDRPGERPEIGVFHSPTLTAFTNLRYVEYVLPLLQNAKKNIDILLYAIRYYGKNSQNDTNRCLRAIIEAKKRGVKVRIVLNLSDYNNMLNRINRKTAEFLALNGVDIRFESPDTITHAKLVMVDDAVIIGSTNWAYSGFSKYNGLDVILKSSPVRTRFQNYFSGIYSHSSKFRNSN